VKKFGNIVRFFSSIRIKKASIETEKGLFFSSCFYIFFLQGKFTLFFSRKGGQCDGTIYHLSEEQIAKMTKNWSKRSKNPTTTSDS